MTWIFLAVTSTLCCILAASTCLALFMNRMQQQQSSTPQQTQRKKPNFAERLERNQQQKRPAAAKPLSLDDPTKRKRSVLARIRQQQQNPSPTTPKLAVDEDAELRRRDESVRASHQLMDVSLVLDAAHEWGTPSRSNSTPARRRPDGTCAERLRLHGLCDPSLLRVPPPRTHKSRLPLVFLHFSKCAGTSIISSLEPMGATSFSLKLPAEVTATPSAAGSACGAQVSRKCCWWRERLQNLSRSGGGVPAVLAQEPANTERWLAAPEQGGGGGGGGAGSDKAAGDFRVQTAVDPGFDGARDFCPAEDFAGYLTVLRHPVARVHSHMCEIGVGFRQWQATGDPGEWHVKKQLRDNYFVRALGGPAAWDAPEGGLRADHLLAAARTLARFDAVMTVETLRQDAAAQMSRLGRAGFRLPHAFSRSRGDNLERARKQTSLQAGGAVAACEVPPDAVQLSRLLAGVAWDAMLHEFATMLAARRTPQAQLFSGRRPGP